MGVVVKWGNGVAGRAVAVRLARWTLGELDDQQAKPNSQHDDPNPVLLLLESQPLINNLFLPVIICDPLDPLLDIVLPCITIQRSLTRQARDLHPGQGCKLEQQSVSQ